MFVLIPSFYHADMGKIIDIYAQSQEKDRIGSVAKISDFLLDFYEENCDAFCAMWQEGDVAASVLRIQSYEDGVLLTGVETRPEYRGKGFAAALVAETLAVLRQQGVHKVYSHVAQRNVPSQKLHKKCGFYKLQDTARLLDGTVTSQMDTLCIEI